MTYRKGLSTTDKSFIAYIVFIILLIALMITVVAISSEETPTITPAKQAFNICAKHDGVRYFNSYSLDVICNDSYPAEIPQS